MYLLMTNASAGQIWISLGESYKNGGINGCKGVDNDTLDCPMVQVWLEDSMEPETVHPLSDGRWVALDGWPSKDVAMKNTFYDIRTSSG